MRAPSRFAVPPVLPCPTCRARCWPGQLGVALHKVFVALDAAHLRDDRAQQAARRAQRDVVIFPDGERR